MTTSANRRIITYKRNKLSGGVAKYIVEYDFSMESTMIGLSKIHFLPNENVTDCDKVLRRYSTHSLVLNMMPIIDDDLKVIVKYLEEFKAEAGEMG